MQELITIDTGADGDYLGHDIALSGDGKTMAVGARGARYVRLYGKDGMDWNMFQQVNGNAYAVDLSHDGSILAVAAEYGAVYMYELSNATYLYELIHTTGDVRAARVSVSGDGSAVGVTYGSNSIFGRIYERIGNGFQQRGSAFTGYGRWAGIAINYNGTIAAVGDIQHHRGRVGRVSMFHWKDVNNDGSMEWLQMGNVIIGDAPYDYFGGYGLLSITYDGLTISVGALGYDGGGNDKGHVRVYNYSITEDVWEKTFDVVGDNSKDNLCTSKLSSNGKYLAVGAYGGEYIKIFEKIESNYVDVGENVISGEGGNFGSSIDMSAVGDVVVTTANNFNTSKGRAYSLIGLTSPSSAPSAAASKTDFALTFLKDDTIIDFDGTSFDKEIIIKTLISNKAPRESFKQIILVGSNCESKLVDEYPDDTTLVTISNDEALDVVEDKAIKVTSEVNIDTSTIASRGTHATDPDNKSIYSEYEEDNMEKAKIEFCIQTDYGKVDVTNSDGSIAESSINFYKVKIVVTVLLQIGFASADVSIVEAEESQAEQAGIVSAVLSACECPSTAVSKDDCFDNSMEYDQNDILSVCVYDPTDNAVITSFKDVMLYNGQISTQVIDSDGKPTSLASVSKLNEGMAIVNTRIISVFFDAGDGALPPPITMSGIATIGFNTSGSRKLTTVGRNGGKNMRKLQDDDGSAVGGEGSFDVEVVLLGDVKVDGSQGVDDLKYSTMLLIMLAMMPIVLF